MRRILPVLVVVCFAAAAALAQDPVKVDPKHYKVEVDNAQVRVLRFHYGPHEKSVMHSHPDLVLVTLTDGHTKFTMPDGTTREMHLKASEASWWAAATHLPENMGDKAMEGILVEMKGKAPAAAKPAAKTKARAKKASE